MQVTTRIARDFSPRKIVGMDIDTKLVKIAWKNLYRLVNDSTDHNIVCSLSILNLQVFYERIFSIVL